MYIDAVLTQLNNCPQDTFLGVKYDHKNHYVETFVIYNDEVDEFIGVNYDAGELFSSDGEEGSFSVEEVKNQIRFVDFKKIDIDSWSFGLCAEYYMYNLFPDDLQDPEEVFTEDEKNRFASRLDELINGKDYESC